MIENLEYVIDRTDIMDIDEVPDILTDKFSPRLLRWFISKVTVERIHVEITLFKGAESPFRSEGGTEQYGGRSVVLCVIPTGIGCSIGGYAADAAPAVNLLATCCDYLVTNPNAVNASNFIAKNDNVLYTEGFLIDQFCRGIIDLHVPYGNRVGLIINQPQPRELEMVLNLVNTVRAVHGVDIEHCIVTEDSIGGCCVKNKSGSFVGNIDRPEVLFSACEKLISRGVNAVAVTSNIKDLPLGDYADHFEGKCPNPIGGAEAVISHLICRKYRLPAAHAPLLNIKDLALKHRVVDARGAGEFASTSGLVCVLIGLRNAPQVMPGKRHRLRDIVNHHNLMAVVAPSSAVGGIPMLYAHKYGIPLVAVRDNQTILEVTPAALGLREVYEVNNYAEAAGIIQALRSGIAPRSLYRPLSTIRM